MNADVYAEWLKRQGQKVIRTDSSYWYEAGPGVLQAYPHHWTIEPSDAELRKLLVDQKAIALRYSAPIECSQGMVSYHVVCEDPAYDMETLSRQARQNTRKGLDYFTIEQISFSRLAEEGWRLHKDSLDRQRRKCNEDEAWWRRLCASAEGLPGFEVWAATHDGQLAAAFIAFQCGNVYTLPYEQSSSAFLEQRVNNAIFFQVARQAIRREDITSVFFCLESLDAPASVNEFKFRMGFTAKPVRQRVVFHPLAAPFASRLAHRILIRLLQLYPGRQLFAKGEGMLRFYLEGKKPIRDQVWPKPLEGSRDTILNSLESTTGKQSGAEKGV